MKIEECEEQSKDIATLRAELEALKMEALKNQVPDGWKLVPVEPTTEMYLMALERAFCPAVDALIIYQAMLAAAPHPKRMQAALFL